MMGVRLDLVDMQGGLLKAQEMLESQRSHMIFTPNPEMLVLAQKDTYFAEVLQESSLNLCDGIGIRLLSGLKVPKVAGVDFMTNLLGLAQEKGKSVYLLGTGSSTVLKQAQDKLRVTYPQLNICGTHPGLEIKIGENYDRIVNLVNTQENDKIIDDIIDTSPDILIVAFGHGKQEKWIYENLPHLPSVRMALGVGGAIDYLSNNVRRAPKWIQSLGLEWLFRLSIQPRRIKRILTAIITFPLLYIKSIYARKTTS